METHSTGDNDPTAASSSTPVAAKPPQKRKQTGKNDLAAIAQECLNEFRKSNSDTVENTVSSTNDTNDLFGQYVAGEIRKIPNDIVAQMLKSEIQNLIVRAHTGYFGDPRQHCTTSFSLPSQVRMTNQWKPSGGQFDGTAMSPLLMNQPTGPYMPQFSKPPFHPSGTNEAGEAWIDNTQQHSTDTSERGSIHGDYEDY